MSACTVWALILAVAAIVATGFAYRYKHLANRMKARINSQDRKELFLKI